MQTPKILTTNVQNESFGGFIYHIQGELVPVLVVDLNENRSIYFEHHILLWKNPSIAISLRSMRGALKRMMAGIQIFITQATGPGQIALSRDGAGHIVALHLKPGREVHVREHQFLAATENVNYTYSMVRGVGSLLFGGSGFFIDSFSVPSSEGILWLHGFGNVFEITLAPGEQIDIEPGSWLYKDASVQMSTHIQNLSTGFLSSMSFVMNRFTGPGVVGIQSMYLHYPSSV